MTARQPPTANPARVYDYLLGGKNNFAVDREAGRKLIAAKPDLRANVRENRRFLARAVAYLAADQGIRQFLDIGTGLPVMDHTHEVAQRIAPESRVVYVDNDPEVLVHGRAMLTSTALGSAAFLEADLREPATILARAAEMLDFSRPVAVMLLGILYLIEDGDDPYGIVRQLAAAVPAGSFMVISHPASDIHADQAAAGALVYARQTGIAQTNRSREQVAGFLAGLEIVPPGVVPLNQWLPWPGDDTSQRISSWAAAGRKP